MILRTVGTGSDGNCYLLQRGNGHYIALDCGMPWKQVLVGCDFQPTLIDFALCSHEHRDHNRYARDFEKNLIPVYGTWNLEEKKVRSARDVKFVPFELPHDVKCYGYILSVDGEKVIYMTDYGYCRYTFLSHGIQHWIVACNHIEPPARDEFKFKHVIEGHSDLRTVKNLLRANKADTMKNIVLCHYSEGVNTDRMIQEVYDELGGMVNVCIARKGEAISL